MAIEDMNEGVRMLAERMKTNPEEFNRYGKWNDMLAIVDDPDHVKFLTAEEIKYLQETTREMQRQRFTTKVLETLVRDEAQEDVLSKPSIYAYGSAGGGSMGSTTSIAQAANYSLSALARQNAMSQQAAMNASAAYTPNWNPPTQTSAPSGLLDKIKGLIP
jgi:hypothetical protein